MLEEGVEGLGVSEREGGAGGSDTGARGGEIERMERERESGASDPLLAAREGVTKEEEEGFEGDVRLAKV